MNNKKRKYAAAALALAGVAGLSLAAAATLTVNASNEIAIGSDTFAPCQGSTAVGIDYTYKWGTNDFVVGTVTVDGFVDECNGENIAVYVAKADGTPAFEDTGKVEAGKFTFEASPEVPIATDLGLATIIVSG